MLLSCPLNFPISVWINIPDFLLLQIRVCGITENIYCNNYYDFDRVSEGIVDNLEKDKIYKLRVLGYSEGGDGKMSEVVYFTLGEYEKTHNQSFIWYFKNIY